MKTSLTEYKRAYYQKNRDAILAKSKARKQRVVSPEQRAEYNRRHRERYREKYITQAREHYAENRLSILAGRKERRERDPTVLAAQRIARGLPPPTRPCPECCELCSRVFERGKIHLDHDHATGLFRGWLCNRCNMSLGHLGDSIRGLQRAIAYLERTTCG